MKEKNKNNEMSILMNEFDKTTLKNYIDNEKEKNDIKNEVCHDSIYIIKNDEDPNENFYKKSKM